jgi:hypothetical protein
MRQQPVTAQLPRDVCRVAAEFAGDLGPRSALRLAQLDGLPLGQGQIAAGGLGQRHRRHPAIIEEPRPPLRQCSAKPGC